jgi:hypothetical protein
MITFDIVFPGRLLSDTDRKRSESIGHIITNPILQTRLESIDKTLREHEEIYGPGGRSTIRGVEFAALFGSEWELHLEVQLFIGQRRFGPPADMDNLWGPLQNALAFPPWSLEIPGCAEGSRLFTLVEDDRQFTRYSLQRVTYPAGNDEGDLTAIRLTALPPPHLRLTRLK